MKLLLSGNESGITVNGGLSHEKRRKNPSAIELAISQSAFNHQTSAMNKKVINGHRVESTRIHKRLLIHH